MDNFSVLSLIKVVKTPYEACNQAHAMAILTEWDEFKTLDFKKIHSGMLKPAFVFDGRAILPVDKLNNIGFQTYSIGKG